MIIFTHFFIAFSASIIGAISGIGGGIIIKPVLDAFGLFEIGTITFLSGCTVLSMSGMSLFLNRKSEVSINHKIAGSLAISGIAGGLLGKYLFNLSLQSGSSLTKIQIIQSSILIFLSVGVLIFTLNKLKIRPLHLKNTFICLITGLLLGFTGAFLGIGGGPINLLVLYFFFSMDSKTAAINSLFIIFFSQLSSLLLTVFSQNIPEFNPTVLLFMIFGGILGALLGSKVSKKLNNRSIDNMFMVVLTLIIGICAYNILRIA